MPTSAASPPSPPTAPCSAELGAVGWRDGTVPGIDRTGAIGTRWRHGLADPLHGRGPRADPGQPDARPAVRDGARDVAAPRRADAVAQSVRRVAQPGRRQANA